MNTRVTALLIALAVTSGCATAKQETPPTPEVVETNTPRNNDVSKTETATGDLAQAILHLRRVHFAYDSARLLPSGQAALVEAAERLAKHPNVSIYVEGHADRRGDNAYNMRLGDRRARAVSAFLVQRGISAARLNVVSYGFTQPLVSGAAPAALAANRRADFKLMRGDVELIIDGGVLIDDSGKPMNARTASH